MTTLITQSHPARHPDKLPQLPKYRAHLEAVLAETEWRERRRQAGFRRAVLAAGGLIWILAGLLLMALLSK